MQKKGFKEVNFSVALIEVSSTVMVSKYILYKNNSFQ